MKMDNNFPAWFDIEADPPTQGVIEQWKEEAEKKLKILNYYYLTQKTFRHLWLVGIGFLFLQMYILGVVILVVWFAMMFFLDRSFEDWETEQFLDGLANLKPEDILELAEWVEEEKTANPAMARYVEKIALQGRNPKKGELKAIQEYLRQKNGIRWEKEQQAMAENALKKIAELATE